MFFALSSFFTRLGLERGTTGAAVRTANLVGVAAAWPLFFLFAPFSSLSSWAVLTFIAAGVCGPFLGRFLLFTGLQRVGVAVTTPIYNMQVLFTALAGVLFFREALTLFIGGGTLVMLVGLALLGFDASGGNRDRPRRALDLLFPLGRRVLHRDHLCPAEVGAADHARGVPRPGGDVEHVVPDGDGRGRRLGARDRLPARPYAGDVRNRRLDGRLGAPLRSGSTAAEATSLIVVPLQNMEPLFAVVLSRLFLRRLELVTPAVAAGAALVVTGGVLVNL